MDFDDYLRHDATSLAALVAQGEATPHELLDLALARQHQVHGRVNAIVRLMDTEARRQLQGPLRGPFAGVPFLLKDTLQDYAGRPTTTASRSRAGRRGRRRAASRGRC